MLECVEMMLRGDVFGWMSEGDCLEPRCKNPEAKPARVLTAEQLPHSNRSTPRIARKATYTCLSDTHNARTHA